MKKKTNVKDVIRKIVREEVALAIREVITELKTPSLSSRQVSKPKPKKKIVEKKTFSKNSILNEVLNETEGFGTDDYALMGDKVYDSSTVEEVARGGNMSDKLVSPGAPDAIKDIFNKDFSKILKQSYKKRG
tara:strand:+ start:4802 stop:5197 length:396 start_codon:yes stop_codon:yes gene_type:complete